MKALTVEDLYIQSKIDEFENYKLYIKSDKGNVPLVVHEQYPEENKLVLWAEEDLKNHLKSKREK